MYYKKLSLISLFSFYKKNICKISNHRLTIIKFSDLIKYVIKYLLKN